MTPSRREFLQTLAATGAAVALAPRSARATDSRIDVMLDEPIGTIAPELYGHFAEHLGGVSTMASGSVKTRRCRTTSGFAERSRSG